MFSKSDPHRVGAKGTSIQCAVLAMLLSGITCLPSMMFSRDDRSNESVPPPVSGTADAADHHPNAQQVRARAVSVIDVVGTVKLSRPGLPGQDPVAAYAPIQQGSKLFSSADSIAGIAFEHDSSIIVGPNSRVFFHQLAL